jgi:hypothetical protein
MNCSRAFLLFFACASAAACSGKAQTTGSDAATDTLSIGDAGSDSATTTSVPTDSTVGSESGLPPCTFDNGKFDNCVFSP